MTAHDQNFTKLSGSSVGMLVVLTQQWVYRVLETATIGADVHQLDPSMNEGAYACRASAAARLPCVSASTMRECATSCRAASL
jgi:hypothetical protein